MADRHIIVARFAGTCISCRIKFAAGDRVVVAGQSGYIHEDCVAEEEIWKDIPGYEGLYKASTLGRILSLQTNTIRKPDANKKGYLRVTLYSRSTGCKSHAVHRLVLLTFKGPKPPGLDGKHLDDVKSNCRLDNLEYGTRSSNMQDAIRNGVVGFYKGSKHSDASRLKMSESAKIRTRPSARPAVHHPWRNT